MKAICTLENGVASTAFVNSGIYRFLEKLVALGTSHDPRLRRQSRCSFGLHASEHKLQVFTTNQLQKKACTTAQIQNQRIGNRKNQMPKREEKVTLERKMERSLGEGEGEESGDGSIVFLEEDWDLLCFFFFIMVTYL